MSALLERASQAVSITRLSRSAKEIFEKLSTGEETRLLVLRNNAPAGVVLGVKTFEALMDELEDLRADSLALERLKSLQPSETIPREEMMRRFGPRRK